MLHFPQFNPVALSLGPVQIHWYGIMYLIGFACAWGIASWRVKYLKLDWDQEQITDLIFYAALGIIIGGRLGYILFYDNFDFIHNPFKIIRIWEGGMSFHGGLIGSIIGLSLFAKHYHKSFMDVADFTAPLVPLGLAFGRFGNFINGELWGRTTNMPWAMAFPDAGPMPRHPSQLYEMGLEGIILFIILFIYSLKPRPKARPMALFLICYSLFRFSLEFFREPDYQLGLYVNLFSMGQLLSLPMFFIGLYLWSQHAKLSQST